MYGKLDHHPNFAQRLLAHIRRRRLERLLRVLDQNAEWCRQAQQAPPLSASGHWPPARRNAKHQPETGS